MFGTELQGRESHEALLRLHDTEVRVLENIRQCVKMRVDNDRQYATGLLKMTQQAAKFDFAEFLDTSAFFRAWDTVLKQTEAFAVELKRTADEINQSLIESLSAALLEKKKSTKMYSDERTRLEKEFIKLQEKVHQQKDEYGRCVDRVKQDRAKFKDIQTKGKSGPKLDEARSRQRKSTTRLHQVHNDYVISLRDVTSQQASYLGTTLPALLNSHQVSQEALVSLSKGILAEYVRLTDFSSERYHDMFALMTSDVQRVAPDKEYTSSFLPKNRSDLQTPSVFEFDDHLLDDYGSLDPGQITVDELSVDHLKARREELKTELETQRMCLEDRTAAIEERLKEEEKLAEKAKLDPSLPALQALCEARRKRAQTQKEKAETEALVTRLRTVVELIDGPLKELGDATAPAVSDLEMQDPDSLSTTSGAESKPAKKRSILTLPKSFARKATGATSTLAGIFRNTSNDTADGEGSDDGKATPSEISDSYEQHDPNNMDTDNGPSNRMSIDVMREQGMMKSADFPPIFEKMEDNEWFHGVLPREEVQRLLVSDGNYLVRESKNKRTNEVQYVLSVYWEGYKHFIIQGHEGSWRLEGLAFPTIPQLVQYQHASGLPITNKSQAYLRKPVLREEWELMNDHINLNEKIGNGNFGEVYKGVFWPKNLVVAVKTCKDTLSEDQRKKFLEEGRILRQYNHPNIVQFIGIAAQRQPVMIVMEYVSGGALLQFLRRNGSRCIVRDLTRMCSDASCGMAYLEEKKCIHRDLAARNCLIGENNMVKISDFGMSREEQVYTVSGGMKQIPIKWTAPEALNYGQYTSLCDVWSFGVLMWEVFSLGKTPYPGMDNATAKHRIEENYRMPPPNQTPSEVARLMSKCWEYKPEERPHFQEIYDTLQSVLTKLGH